VADDVAVSRRRLSTMTHTQHEDLSDVLPAVWNLLGDYARHMDNQRAVEWTRLFGGTGTLALPDREISGESELNEFVQQTHRGVHVQGVPTVERRADGSLSVTSNFVFVNAVTYGVTAGEYRDELGEGDGGLFFARREITIRVRTTDEPPTE
jgi:hypothetical protein